jgi:hypothetical protein
MDSCHPFPKDYASPPAELPLLASHSISGFVTFMAGGSIQWKSNRQITTVQSSSEAENDATCLLGLAQHVSKTFLSWRPLSNLVPPLRYRIFNDNLSCVDWSTGTTIKCTCHIQKRENLIRENRASGILTVRDNEQTMPLHIWCGMNQDRKILCEMYWNRTAMGQRKTPWEDEVAWNSISMAPGRTVLWCHVGKETILMSSVNLYMSFSCWYDISWISLRWRIIMNLIPRRKAVPSIHK